jgi:hypothetical protein
MGKRFGQLDPDVQAVGEWFHDLAQPTERERGMLDPPKAPQPHPCDKCGAETCYSPLDVVNLHTRSKLDEWDNLYACAKDYIVKHRVVANCRLCSQLISDVVPLGVDEPREDTCWACQKWPPGTGEPA